VGVITEVEILEEEIASVEEEASVAEEALVEETLVVDVWMNFAVKLII
jgi:hypothetical protein